MTSNTIDIFSQIQEFISSRSGIPKNKINIDSTLEGDLKIYGDDTVDLIFDYSKEFNVNVENFNFRNHVASEGDTILPMILRLFKSKHIKQFDLTVLDLVNGINAGKLDETIVNSNH